MIKYIKAIRSHKLICILTIQYIPRPLLKVIKLY